MLGSSSCTVFPEMASVQVEKIYTVATGLTVWQKRQKQAVLFIHVLLKTKVKLSPEQLELCFCLTKDHAKHWSCLFVQERNIHSF